MPNKNVSFLIIFLLILSFGCSIPFAIEIKSTGQTTTPTSITPSVQATTGLDDPSTPTITKEPVLTQDVLTQPIETQTPIAPNTTLTPECVTLQPINLRSGPGTAFNPPINAIDADTKAVPEAFNPTGIPSGSWIKIFIPSLNQTGWINAGAAFVHCNIDITGLPSENVSSPPTALPPMVSNTQPDGMLDAYQLDVKTSPYFLMDIRVRVKDGDKNGDGIKKVHITISDNNGVIYQIDEKSPLYCAFGGNSNCNPWPASNGEYYWGVGGPKMEKGTYSVVVDIIPQDSQLDNGQCNFKIKLK